MFNSLRYFIYFFKKQFTIFCTNTLLYMIFTQLHQISMAFNSFDSLTFKKERRKKWPVRNETTGTQSKRFLCSCVFNRQTDNLEPTP